MVKVSYKQRCNQCKKNMVLISGRSQYPICYDCQKAQLSTEIKDPAMKAMFDIPEEFYMQNMFLRSIKINYIKYEGLSEKQIECFVKTVQEMKKKKE
ncbi:MAG: hypothetical protein WC755_00100 [Candidatus Woesearchaeota archaeon]|jgi:hypothetical protein